MNSMLWQVILCLPIILVQRDLKLLKNVEALATLEMYAQNEAVNIIEDILTDGVPNYYSGQMSFFLFIITTTKLFV